MKSHVSKSYAPYTAEEEKMWWDVSDEISKRTTRPIEYSDHGSSQMEEIGCNCGGMSVYKSNDDIYHSRWCRLIINKGKEATWLPSGRREK